MAKAKSKALTEGDVVALILFVLLVIAGIGCLGYVVYSAIYDAGVESGSTKTSKEDLAHYTKMLNDKDDYWRDAYNKLAAQKGVTPYTRGWAYTTNCFTTGGTN